MNKNESVSIKSNVLSVFIHSKVISLFDNLYFLVEDEL